MARNDALKLLALGVLLLIADAVDEIPVNMIAMIIVSSLVIIGLRRWGAQSDVSVERSDATDLRSK